MEEKIIEEKFVTIRVSEELWKKLNSMKSIPETFEQVIWRLISLQETKQGEIQKQAFLFVGKEIEHLKSFLSKIEGRIKEIHAN